MYWSPVIVQTEHKDMYYVIAELSPDLDLDPDPDPDQKLRSRSKLG